jgi:hypothetical protein
VRQVEGERAGKDHGANADGRGENVRWPEDEDEVRRRPGGVVIQVCKVDEDDLDCDVESIVHCRERRVAGGREGEAEGGEADDGGER